MAVPSTSSSSWVNGDGPTLVCWRGGREARTKTTAVHSPPPLQEGRRGEREEEAEIDAPGGKD